MTVNVEAILIGLFSVAHTPAQAEHAAREVLRQHAHQLAEKIREDVGDDIAAHPGFAEMAECEGCATVRAANLIDPEVES